MGITVPEDRVSVGEDEKVPKVGGGWLYNGNVLNVNADLPNG